ncbi:MAG: sigma 54-interacting transcriptional regulator, partial [SAR324 cluster bacterium]|nr:sigma 54-interacting transcriptional regulator [SAR324 cluster bacterium]
MTRKQPQVNYLSESPIALQQLIDEIPSGISILDMDRKIILMNRALEAMTGFSSSAARGLPCYQVRRSGICIHKCPLREENKRFESIFVESDIINRDRQRIPVNINIASLKNLQDQVVGYLETVADLRAIRELDAKISHAYSFSSIIGRSPQMEKIYQIMPVLAQSDSSVLITGETGTGKDLVAEALHQASNRSKGQFIKVNCGALPETLLESELFGHQKGAFTGAVENKPGRFRLAHNGTLFLTEIGDLPLPLQVKLLTFLDDQVIYPLGSTKGFQANVRVIAGTHRNLEQMVRQGLFRSDLLFRLNVVHIHLPPLRSREGDLELLLDHFVRTLNLRFQKKISGVSKTTLQLLRQYSFPGNVRELRNIIEYAANICDRGQIEPEDLPTYILDIKNDPS